MSMSVRLLPPNAQSSILLTHLKAAINGKEVVEAIEVKDGTILKIDSEGLITTAEFNYNEYGSFGCSWWDFGISTNKSRNLTASTSRKMDMPDDAQEYLAMLRMTASELGYDPQDVDKLYSEGFSITDIEQLLYDPDSMAEYYDYEDGDEGDSLSRPYGGGM